MEWYEALAFVIGIALIPILLGQNDKENEQEG